MKNIFAVILTALILVITSGCAEKEGFVDPILKSRFYTDSNDPCINLLFPFDVAMGRKETEQVSGIYLHTRHLTSSDYAIRVIKMRLERGFFRSKSLAEVYKDEDILYQRDSGENGQTSAVVLRQRSAEGCEYIKGRIEHRVGDRSMVDVDFRRRITEKDDINELRKQMKATLDFVFEKMIVSFCSSNKL